MRLFYSYLTLALLFTILANQIADWHNPFLAVSVVAATFFYLQAVIAFIVSLYSDLRRKRSKGV